MKYICGFFSWNSFEIRMNSSIAPSRKVNLWFRNLMNRPEAIRKASS